MVGAGVALVVALVAWRLHDRDTRRLRARERELALALAVLDERRAGAPQHAQGARPYSPAIQNGNRR